MHPIARGKANPAIHREAANAQTATAQTVGRALVRRAMVNFRILCVRPERTKLRVLCADEVIRVGALIQGNRIVRKTHRARDPRRVVGILAFVAEVAVRREKILIVPIVKQPGGLHLFEVAETGSGLGFGARHDEHWQKQTGQNRYDRDYHQQLDQRERPTFGLEIPNFHITSV